MKKIKTYLYKCALVREKEVMYTPSEIGCVSDAEKLLDGLGIKDMAEEVFYVICMNAKGKIIGIHECSHGSVTSTEVHPREVFKRALINSERVVRGVRV